MKIFRDYTLKWWQASILKLSLLSLGIMVGAYWADFFSGYYTLLWIVFVVTMVYLLALMVKLMKED